jgi:hypothetical protein
LLTVHSQAHLLDTMPAPVKTKVRIIKVSPAPAPPPKTKRNYHSSVTQKRCVNCDDCFVPSKSTQKFCSNKCRQKSFRLKKSASQNSNKKYCVRCHERLTGRQRKYCSATCKQLTHRTKKRATVHQYQKLGIKLSTVLDSIELIGMSKSTMALQGLGFAYSVDQKKWVG